MFKPMLAARCEDITALDFGREWCLSPKLDGIRCIIQDGIPVSRKLKPIPNEFIRSRLGGLPSGLDGELIVGSPAGARVFNTTSSGVMSQDGEPDFIFHVFDYMPDPLLPFRWRYGKLVSLLAALHHPHLELVKQERVRDIPYVTAAEEHFVRHGYEGVMVRREDMPYKYGRSTLREGGLLKVKRFKDAEARVVAVLEGHTNTNMAKRNAVGAIERSTDADGMVGNGQVGTLVCKDIVTEQVINVSPGKLTQAERIKYWGNQTDIIDRLIKYRYFESGSIDKPRFPTFQGFRNPLDLD